jgi:hypothetical protein
MLDSTLAVIALSHLFTGIVGSLVTVPLLLGKVPMNRWYGIRVKEAFVSEDQWQRINRYGAKRLMAGWLVCLVLGVLTLLASEQQKDLVLASLGLPALILLGIAVDVVRFARKSTGTR